MSHDSSRAADRRRYPRLPYDGRVIVISAGHVATLAARDIAVGGMFLYAADTPPLGTRVQAEFDLDSGRRFSLPATVVRHECPPAGSGTGGFAVAFEARDELRSAFGQALGG